MKTARKIIRADGTEEELTEKQTIDQICKLINAQDVDVIWLSGNEYCMLINDDETGIIDAEDTALIERSSINAKATALFVRASEPKILIDSCIGGDVVIAPISDFIP